MIPKFRAWHKGFKIMSEVNLIDIKSQQVLLQDANGCYDFEQIELMQSSGLQDTNGEDIYEGDIISYNSLNLLALMGDSISPILKHTVLFEHGMFGVKYGHLPDIEPLARCAKYNEGTLSVIGNIYENPELLESEK